MGETTDYTDTVYGENIGRLIRDFPDFWIAAGPDSFGWRARLRRDDRMLTGRELAALTLDGLARQMREIREGIRDARAKVLALPVGGLDLSVRCHNALKLGGVASVGDLVARSQADLTGTGRLSLGAVSEIRLALSRLGLALAGDPPC